MTTATHFRTCPLCEATCGLAITMADGRITSIRGDQDDVFSKGFICPKGTALKHLEEDPDRLHTPLVRKNGRLEEATWEDAFLAVERGLRSVLDEHGRNAVALYAGNPTVHSLSVSVMLPTLVRALGSQNFYSAATVDQMPKHVSSGYMFGRPELIPVPDIDRTDYLLVIGANPWVSNGSLATAPDFRGRLEAISARGGKVVVLDPRRTETAAGADRHVFIRPGTDAHLLLAMIKVAFDEDLVTLGSAAGHVEGLDQVREAAGRSDIESAARITGIDAGVIRELTREFAAAGSAAVYDRVGAHQQRFGTLVSWASDVLTTITGNLDAPGGKMWALPAHGEADPPEPRGRGWRTGRFTSRVSGHREAYGQLPIACLAEEIETQGDGRVRALITIAGNPVLSAPNGTRVSNALESLDFMVAVDPFVNETTRHADVILPPTTIMSRHHYDYAFYALSVRNIVNYSPPSIDPSGPDEWEILSRLALVASNQSVLGDPEVVPGMALGYLIQRATAAGGALEGRDPEEIARALEGRAPVEKILDLSLRAGPYGDLFGARDGLSLARLEEEPHGIDLGPLEPRLPNLLKTASGKVELAPPEILSDLDRLAASLDEPVAPLVLIGRRQLRSNNSWMHNVPALVKGKERCTLLLSPKDAKDLDLADGAMALVRSRIGEVEAAVEVSDEMMPGVASLPHGWGHGREGTRLSVANASPGVSSNDLTDDSLIDPLSGNAALNEVPIEVSVLTPASP